MQQRAERLRDFSDAIAARRWEACPTLLYRILYGLPPVVLLPLTAGQIARMLLVFEQRWPNVTWPREIVGDTQRWISQFGRAIPDSPERESVAEARFVFSLDALLLATSYPDNASVLTSSCACAIREIVGVGVELSSDESEETLLDECEGCGAALKQKPAPDPDSPIEIARSREWQTVLDALLAHKVHNYPDPESQEQLEADLGTWIEHAELLIVPDAAANTP